MAAKRTWPWYPFVILAIASAIVPGFLLGGLAGGAAWLGFSAAAWYLPGVQAHGHALLLGWGAGMILGVALHFLPRLRGAKLADPGWVPPLFWCLAGGTVLRAGGQPLAAAFSAAGALSAARALGYAAALGVSLQAAGGIGLVWLLARTLRQGPPLSQKTAFLQVRPLFVLSAAAFGLALIMWVLGAAAWLAGSALWAIFGAVFNRVAVEVMLFGAVVTISLAMSSRLFPLLYRVPLADTRLLWLSAALLALGTYLVVVGGALAALGTANQFAVTLAALLHGSGIALGAAAVRVFGRRTPFPGDRGRYRIVGDPGAVAAVTAYVWALFAAVVLVLFALQNMGLYLLPGGVPRDLGLHAVGAGFMTLLIYAVGWHMLPGFGGGQPRGRACLWLAVALGNAAVLLRILPGSVAAVWGQAAVVTWTAAALALAGLAGLLAMIFFAAALAASWRKG